MRSLTEYVSEHAERRPDAPAVEFEDETLTYGELHRQSSALAAALLGRGLPPGARVALWLRKSIESIVAVHGILKAGAAYVPIDPSAPLDRVGRVLSDCEVAAVVTSDDQADWLLEHPDSAAFADRIVAVGTDGAPVADAKIVGWSEALGEVPDTVPAIDAADPAFVLYTSGSKGVPKGVTLSHANAGAFVEWAAGEFGLSPADRVASHAPLHFDLSVLDVFATCLAGGCVVLIPEGYAGLGGALNRFVADRRVSVWYSVPNALTRMLAAKNHALLSGSALRVVLFAGETFPVDRLRRLHELLPSVGLYNLYGPTETNVCTFHRVRESDVALERTEPVPIGLPCPYATAFVLDQDDRPVPREHGRGGELCVAGDSVMLGYWRDPGLTAAKTVMVTGDDGVPVPAYRTGDQVRFDADLNYVFCGREDDMVKIRGHRVELGEIESVLSGAENVGEVACVAVDDGTGEKRVEAYVVPESLPCDVARIRRHCGTALPRYMVPEKVHIVAALPRSGTGKIDRRSLPTA